MTTLNKVLIATFTIIMVGAVGFIIYQQHEMTTMQAQLNSSLVAQKQLIDGLTQSSAQYVSKSDLDAFAKQTGVNLAAIQSDLNSLNATVSGVNQIAVNSGGEKQSGIGSTSTTPDVTKPATTPSTNTDPFGYQSNVQNLSLNEPFGGTQVPIGSVSFDASQKAPWSVNQFPRTYSVTNVLGTDPTGKQYIVNKFNINTNGKDYPITITNAKFEQQVPTASFSWWNPRLILAATGSINLTHLQGEFAPGVNLGIMSFGKTKSQPDLSILQIGVGYGVISKTAIATIAPINYNIGNLIPGHIVDNTYVGPTFQVGANGNLFAGVGVGVGF